jgi:TolA-binding protein
MRKTLLSVLAMAALAAPTGPAHAQAAAPKTPPAKPQPAESSSGLKDMLGNFWGRLRALTPRSSPAAATTANVPAGLRGVEATESELRPYWRGSEPPARAELQALERAQATADAGNFADAARQFEAFLQQHPTSPLASNALFGAALARAALGERQRAAAAFADFIKRDPQHPLADDARQALAALR